MRDGWLIVLQVKGPALPCCACPWNANLTRSQWTIRLPDQEKSQYLKIVDYWVFTPLINEVKKLRSASWNKMTNAPDSRHCPQYPASYAFRLTAPSRGRKFGTSVRPFEMIGPNDGILPVTQIHASISILVFVRVSYFNMPRPDSSFWFNKLSTNSLYQIKDESGRFFILLTRQHWRHIIKN